MHTNYVAGFFDAMERTTFASTDTIAEFWSGRKGLATCTPPLAHLLRLAAMHQRSNQNLPRQDFVSGVDNDISDHPSRSADLSYDVLLACLDATYP